MPLTVDLWAPCSYILGVKPAMQPRLLHNNNKKIWAALLALGIGTISISAAAFFLQSDSTQRSEDAFAVASESSLSTITALGRLEPEGEITRLSPPAASQRLAQVLVAEGEQVTAGQVIAISDSLETRQAALAEAEAKVQSAQARLATVRAGRPAGEISAQDNKVAMVDAQWTGDRAAQTYKISSLEAELLSAESEYERYRGLYEEGAVSASELETKSVAVATLKEQILSEQAVLERIVQAGQAQAQAEKDTLENISAVRSVDVFEAETKVSEALALLYKAAADMELAYVRSPIDGQVLALHAKAGETVGPQGIADIGKTQQMYAVAEVYETDIRHVKIGQQATLISEYGGFAGELAGTVEHIGLQIDKPGTANNDPSTASDVRVIEVKIRLDPEESEQVRHLNQLQVRASIKI